MILYLPINTNAHPVRNRTCGLLVSRQTGHWNGGIAMKEKWKKFRMGVAAQCVGMLVLGIVLVAWPGISALTVCMVLGAICILAGIYELARYFKLGAAGVFFRFDSLFGICSILAGIFLLLHPYGAAKLLPIAAGLFVLSRSIQDIQTAFGMRSAHVASWGAVLAIGLIDLVFAVLLLANPFGGAAALMVFIGIVLIISGLRHGYMVYCISRAVKASRNDDVIDVEWKSLD